MDSERNDIIKEYPEGMDGKELSMSRYAWSVQPENEAYAAFMRNSVVWKLHLNLRADHKDPLTREVCEFLDQQTEVQSYKVGIGGEEQDGKGMTIYIGSFERAKAVACRLHAKFGDRLPKMKVGPFGSDVRMIGEVAGRFDAQRFLVPPKPGRLPLKYGGAGRGQTNGFGVFSNGYPNRETLQYASDEERCKILMNLVMNYVLDFGDYLLGDGKAQPVIDAFNNAPESRKYEAAAALMPEWIRIIGRNGRVPMEYEILAPELWQARNGGRGAVRSGGPGESAGVV